MAWTTPRDWAEELVTVAMYNEQIRDNLNYLYEMGLYRAMNGALAAPAASASITGWQTAATDYQSLLLMAAYVRSDLAAAYQDPVLMTFNDDAVAANYDGARLTGVADAVASSDWVGTIAGIQLYGGAAAVNADANCFGYFLATILQPSSTTLWKVVHFVSGVVHTTLNEYVVAQGNGVWESMDPITKITLAPAAGANLLAGLVWNMYGNL